MWNRSSAVVASELLWWCMGTQRACLYIIRGRQSLNVLNFCPSEGLCTPLRQKQTECEWCKSGSHSSCLLCLCRMCCRLLDILLREQGHQINAQKGSWGNQIFVFGLEHTVSFSVKNGLSIETIKTIYFKTRTARIPFLLERPWAVILTARF